MTTILMRYLSAQAAVLGFVGSPWTLATYLIEGGSTPLYKKIKAMTAAAPDVLSALLQHLAVQIAEYMCFQVGDARRKWIRRESAALSHGWLRRQKPAYQQWRLPKILLLAHPTLRPHSELSGLWQCWAVKESIYMLCRWRPVPTPCSCSTRGAASCLPR